MIYFFLKNIKNNWKSGLTVSLVSIPLSVSLAVAAGASPTMGIITAVWAGIFAAIFGGNNYNIVGPTGALSGILASYALVNGAESLSLLAIITGIIILLFFAFRFEKYIFLIPSGVIHGFTLGVAFIIGLNQLNFALGLKNLPVHEKFLQNIWETITHIRLFDAGTVVLFLVSFGILFLFLKLAPKIPGPIILAPLGIFLGYLSEHGLITFHLQTLNTKFGDISSGIFNLSGLPTGFPNMIIFKAALAVAIVAILETLISAKIADNMTRTKSHPRKEMLGLGLANIASGFFGGIPATAALARTALNVKSGATHKTSAGISSLAVAGISIAFLPYFKYLPLAVVASILVYVAMRMVETEHFKHLYSHDKPAFGLSFIVAVITVAEDPIFGILIGSVIALLMFVNKLSKGQSEIIINKNKKMVARLQTLKFNEIEKHSGDVVVYRLAGQMNYINSHSHAVNLGKINGAHTLILNFRNLFNIDVDGLDAVGEIIEEMKSKGKKVMITSPGPLILPSLDKADWFQKLQEQGLVFGSTTEALKTLGFNVNDGVKTFDKPDLQDCRQCGSI